MRSRARCRACATVVLVAAALSGCGGSEADGDALRTIVITEVMEPSSPNQLPPGQFTFEGNGTQLLEPVDVPTDTTLHWRAGGGLFMLIVLNDRADIVNPQLVVSEAEFGGTFLPAGHYEFKVTGFADEWAISIE